MVRLLPLLLLLLLVSPAALLAQRTPDTLAAAPDTRARYAEDLDELERMKEKFRQQQERKARERDRGGDLRGTWTDPTVEEQTPPAPAGVNPRDTVQLRSSVRSGLYTPSSSEPAPDERTDWERRMQRDLPREEPVDADEAARLDAEYAQQLAELEALRAKLRESRGEAPSEANGVAPPVFEPTAVTAKSPAAGSAVPAGVTFITNTAYPDGAGYDALDALVEQIRASSGVVEIRVHTARKLDARAAQLLSEERAVTIRNHLLEAGIARENFRVVGYGNHESAAGERVEVITQ